jgi:hypothetical protein
MYQLTGKWLSVREICVESVESAVRTRWQLRLGFEPPSIYLFSFVPLFLSFRPLFKNYKLKYAKLLFWLFHGHCTVLSVTRLYRVELFSASWIGKDLEGSCYNLIEVLSQHCLRDWRKPRSTLVRIVRVPAGIRTEHFSNISQHRYGYAVLLSSFERCFVWMRNLACRIKGKKKCGWEQGDEGDFWT